RRASKGRVRQVLGGGRGPHRDGDVLRTALRAQLRVGLADFAVEFRLQRGLDDPAADLGAGAGEGSDVLDVQRREAVVDALLEVVVRDERLERVGGGGV